MLNNDNITNSVVQGIAFETYVINVLSDYLADQNKSIVSPIDKNLFDAYLPNGINEELKEPLHLEIKASYKSKNEYFKKIEQFAKLTTEASTGAILIILGETFTQPSIDSLTKLAQYKAKRTVYIWDLEIFNKYTKNYQKKYTDFIENPTKAILEDAINNESNVFKEENKEYLINTLKKKYHNEELTLFLGAGVSIDAGIPLWKDLINSMLTEMILHIIKNKHYSLHSKNLLEIINLAYQNQEDSPLAQMRYIRGAFTQKEYNKLLHDIL